MENNQSQNDLAVIEKALKAYLDIADKNRYGGLHEDHKAAKAALEALERIKQPRLF